MKVKTSPDKETWSKFIASRYVLQEMLNEVVVHAKRKWHKMLTQISKNERRTLKIINMSTYIKDCVFVWVYTSISHIYFLLFKNV